MPALELTSDMVGPGRSRRVLADIEAVMLWPGDELRRKRATRATDAVHFKEQFSRQSSGNQRISVSSADLRDVVNTLADAPVHHEMLGEAEVPHRYGSVAGRILLDALYNYRLGGKRGLGWVKKEVQKTLRGKPGFERFSIGLIENRIWPTYRPVAHLWAAHYLLAKVSLAAGARVAFPCRVDDVGHFLAVAEILRREGEGCLLRQYAGTLLDPKTSWFMPPGINLPRTKIQLGGWVLSNSNQDD